MFTRRFLLTTAAPTNITIQTEWGRVCVMCPYGVPAVAPGPLSGWVPWHTKAYGFVIVVKKPDDFVTAALRDMDCVITFLSLVDRIIAIGGRISLPKSNFLVTRFDWCGVENTYAIG